MWAIGLQLCFLLFYLVNLVLSHVLCCLKVNNQDGVLKGRLNQSEFSKLLLLVIIFLTVNDIFRKGPKILNGRFYPKE